MHHCPKQIFRYALLLQGKRISSHLLRNGVIRLKPHRHIPLFWNQKNFKYTCSEIIGETDLLLEDGMDIQELPVIVRKITKAQIPGPAHSLKKKVPACTKINKKPLVQDSEIKEMIEGFEKCLSQRSAFMLLELIPPEEITASVALQALKTIAKFENNQEFRSKYEVNSEDEGDSELFMKHTVINELIDIIIANGDNSEILEALQFVIEDLSEKESSFSFRQKLCDEILIRISDDKFNISEICSSARSLLFSGNQVDIDKLWVGVMERQNDINEENIMDVFRILLHVNLSRSLLIKILCKQLEIVSLKLKHENIAEILSILNEIKEFPSCIIACLSNWISIQILRTNEEQLTAIVEGFMFLPYEEEDMVKALEKYIVEYKQGIRDPELVGAIMAYCNKFRIRSPIIFEKCSEFLVKHAEKVSPSVLKSIILPFGNLYFLPNNAKDFWKVLEEKTMENFIQMYSEDALDVMLCFIYLEKYPMKFVDKIFNPYFLDRLHVLKDSHWINSIRTKLKLVDTALTLECKSYKGPLLLPDMSSSLIKQDSRIQRVSDSLLEILPDILGPEKSMASSVVLKNLPLTELYIVDIIIHPKGKPSLLYQTSSWNDFTAVLIHPPEHYDSRGKYLTGMQVMRKRHLKLLGLNVVDLNYNVVDSLIFQLSELKQYLKAQLAAAEEAFSS